MDDLIRYLKSKKKIKTEKADKLTYLLYDSIVSICVRQNIPLFIVSMNIDKNDKTHFENYNKLKNIFFVDISLPDNKPEYTLLPYDGHPSPLAHSYYCKKLFDKMIATDLFVKYQASQTK